MTTNRSMQVGVDRLIRLTWLERTSTLVLGGNTPPEIKNALQHDLCDVFQSGMTEKRGSLGKTITILMKVWLKTPRELSGLRDTGLEFLKRIPKEDRKVIHWGMMMAVYPVWAKVAAQVGRLLKLQGNAVASQIQRRMREQYGERETVSRRTRYDLRSFVDWGVLHEAEQAGVYELKSVGVISEKNITVWLIEATMLSLATPHVMLKSLSEIACLFPFKLPTLTYNELVEMSSFLDVMTHNMDNELVIQKTQKDKIC